MSNHNSGTNVDTQPVPPTPPRSLRRRLLTRVVVYSALGYVAWCGSLYFFQDTLIFPRKLAPDPLARRPGYVEPIELPLTGGGTVEGWFIRAPAASTEQPAPAVIFFHGNGEIIDYQDRVPQMCQALGLSVLLAEYRGYGRAAGRPSQEGLVADAVRFYDQLAKRPDVDASRIVIQGHSLGGGVAAQLAARRQPAALILESTFTSVASMAHGYGVPEFLCRHPFRTDEIIGNLNMPILIVHGTHDRIVPVEHGRRLHERVPAATYLEYECGHNELPGAANERAYLEEVRAFLTRSGVLLPVHTQPVK